MTLGIVIPLKAKLLSRDWPATCMALKDTLNSLDGQTSPNYEAIVVGHDKPEFMSSNECKTRFFEIEIPPPNPISKSFQFSECIDDKNMKISRAMQLMRNRNHSYWYYLDADDLLHRSFVDSILSKKLQAGCVLDGGYELFKSKRRIVPNSDLSAICGSTSILSDEIFDIPTELNRDTIKVIPWCKYPHFSMDQFFEREASGKFLRVDEKLVAYNRGHGDNLSDVNCPKSFVSKMKTWLKPYVKGKSIDKKVRQDFSLDFS